MHTIHDIGAIPKLIFVFVYHASLKNSTVWCAGTASRQSMYRASSLASAAEDMTVLMIWAIVRTAPLFWGRGVSSGMKKFPLAQLQALDYDRYDASL